MRGVQECLTSGLDVRAVVGSRGVAWHGLDSIGAATKDSMQALAMRGGPYSDAEMSGTGGLLRDGRRTPGNCFRRWPPRSTCLGRCLRGRYMQAVARMEWIGTPIDVETLAALRENWVAIRAKLVAAIDKDYGVFVPTGRTLDPSTRIGEAILTTAAEWDIDAYRLADAVEILWTAEGAAIDEQRDAIRDARKRTGLTVNRISTLENQDRDHADVVGLDDTGPRPGRRVPRAGDWAGV